MFRRFFQGMILLLPAFGSLRAQNNSLVVFSAGGQRFDLRVDNEKINRLPESNIKAFDLYAGKHRVQVVMREDRDSAMVWDSLTITNDIKYLGKEFTYAVVDEGKPGKNRYSLKFISVSDSSGPMIPKVPAEPKVEIPLTNNKTYGILYQAINNKPVFISNFNDSMRTCKVVLGSDDLHYLDLLLAKTNDLEIKYNYVMKTIHNNCYSTEQLKFLVDKLTIELDRLKACEDGYWHLTDKKNATQLNESLRYKSIQEDFNSYLNDIASIEKQQQMKCTTPLPDAAFQKLKETIRSTLYDNEKIKVAKKQVVSNCLSTAQLGALIGLFTHDRDRLEFAKASYPIITDKDNFKSLQDYFQFKETKDEFNKYFSN